MPWGVRRRRWRTMTVNDKERGRVDGEKQADHTRE